MSIDEYTFAEGFSAVIMSGILATTFVIDGVHLFSARKSTEGLQPPSFFTGQRAAFVLDWHALITFCANKFLTVLSMYGIDSGGILY